MAPASTPASPDDRDNFGIWLQSQVVRTGWIGSLAKAAKADRGFPSSGDPEAARAHLSASQADSDMLEALDDAEREWLNQRAR